MTESACVDFDGRMMTAIAIEMTADENNDVMRVVRNDNGNPRRRRRVDDNKSGHWRSRHNRIRACVHCNGISIYSSYLVVIMTIVI